MFKLISPASALLLLSLALSYFILQSFSKGNVNYSKVREFIPDGYEIFDTATGNINGDRYPDMVIVLKSTNTNAVGDAHRPLLILFGKNRGNFELYGRNDSVVLCETCAGVFGDPYKRVSIKDGKVTVVHNVGNTWRWSRVVTFIYESECKEIVLLEDVTNSYHISSPNNPSKTNANETDYGVLPFSLYAYDKGY